MTAHQNDWRTKWTEAMIEELCERHCHGETLTAIGTALGISRGAVGGKIDRLRREWGEESTDMLAHAASEDVEFHDIANAMRLPREVVAFRFADLRRGFGAQGR
jgi:hypothetical protein